MASPPPGLWDEQDGFYYDFIRTAGGTSIPLRVRSMVGLIPLFACLVLEGKRVKKLTGFWKRTEWFMINRKDLFGRVRATATVDVRNPKR